MPLQVKAPQALFEVGTVYRFNIAGIETRKSKANKDYEVITLLGDGDTKIELFASQFVPILNFWDAEIALRFIYSDFTEIGQSLEFSKYSKSPRLTATIPPTPPHPLGAGVFYLIVTRRVTNKKKFEIP